MKPGDVVYFRFDADKSNGNFIFCKAVFKEPYIDIPPGQFSFDGWVVCEPNHRAKNCATIPIRIRELIPQKMHDSKFFKLTLGKI